MHGNRRLGQGEKPAVRLVLDASREAERALEQEARRHPSYADIRHRLGLLRLARRDYEEAQREFEDALGIHPGYRAAYFGLRLSWILQGRTPEGDPARARDVAASREESCWLSVDAAYRRRLAGEDPLPALGAADGSVATGLAAHYAAAFAIQEGDAEAARTAWERAAAQSGVTREVLTRAGLLPWGEESAERSRTLLGDLLWSPLAADLYAYFGRIYASNRLRKEALRCFDQAYLVFPREAQHALQQAEIASAAGEEPAAIEHLRRAIERDPQCAEAFIALGFEYASQGYAEEARQAFTAAAELAPHYADVHYNLALLHVSTEEHEDALREFQQALCLNRSYLPARHSMAALLCRLERHAEGLREYQTILRQGFQSADMLAQMGRAALALGETDEALQYLERAKFQNPEYILTYYYLGQAYRRKGLRNKARSAWRRYLDGASDWHPTLPEEELGEEEAAH